jgi:hypothetical protein
VARSSSAVLIQTNGFWHDVGATDVAHDGGDEFVGAVEIAATQLVAVECADPAFDEVDPRLRRPMLYPAELRAY